LVAVVFLLLLMLIVKIRLGASLVQLITGLVFEGPQLVGQINLELTKLLRKDGFINISEAVGVDSNKIDL
jgi:dihydroorotate dehydrogenase